MIKNYYFNFRSSTRRPSYVRRFLDYFSVIFFVSKTSKPLINLLDYRESRSKKVKQCAFAEPHEQMNFRRDYNFTKF